MMGPPTNSAAVNCQPISSAKMMPSSTTILVDAISNAIAAVKFAPLRNSDRVAMANVRGLSSPSSRTIVDLRTMACTTADNAKPRINAHSISQVTDPATASACPIASISPPQQVYRARRHDRKPRHHRGSHEPRRLNGTCPRSLPSDATPSRLPAADGRASAEQRERPTIGTAHNAAITTATSSQPVTPVPMPNGPLLHTTVVAFRRHSPCAARSNESVWVL